MFRKLFRAVDLANDDSVFVVDLHRGRVELIKGNVPAKFLSELKLVVADTKIDRGMIRGRRQEDYLRLVFSREIPGEFHQQIRNLWGEHAS